jgi:hypothetical protein
MKAQASGATMAPIVNYAPVTNIDARGADAGVEQRLRKFSEEQHQRTKREAVAEVVTGLQRGRYRTNLSAA